MREFMSGNSHDIVFTNVRILDASGEAHLTSGEVVVVAGNRIKSGFPLRHRCLRNGATAMAVQRIDGRGMTLMPGLIDAHLHLSPGTTLPESTPIQMMPLEEHVLVSCVEMAKVVLDAGFTCGSWRCRGQRAAGCSDPQLRSMPGRMPWSALHRSRPGDHHRRRSR